MELNNVEILRIGELRKFESGFYCLDFVVKTDQKYPQILSVQANKDVADEVMQFRKAGDKVDLHINLNGREWTNKDGEVKVFNTINVWKITESVSVTAESHMPDREKVVEENDLPF